MGLGMTEIRADTYGQHCVLTKRVVKKQGAYRCAHGCRSTYSHFSRKTRTSILRNPEVKAAGIIL